MFDPNGFQNTRKNFFTQIYQAVARIYKIKICLYTTWPEIPDMR